MRQFKVGVTFLVFAQLACSSLSAPASPSPAVATVTETQAPTAPTATASPQASPTPQAAVQDLQILEWAVYPYANPADPQNTDPHVEMLVKNPNDFPVRVNTDAVELKFLSASGEPVYSNPNPTFYIWEGSWIRAGETVPLSACICFQTDGVKKQDWKSIALVAPLEHATDIAYTTDVQFSVSKFTALAGDQLGAQINLVNTSGKVLKSFEARVIARDANGKYVGVAIYGSFGPRDNASGPVDIQPGASGGGIVASQIDYFDGPLQYETTAIGILAK